MDNESIDAAELARRINAKAPQVSRDLHGGLSRSTLSRLSTIADALCYDFIPAFVPRADSAKRKRFIEMYRELDSHVCARTGVETRCRFGEEGARKKDISRAW